MKNKTKKKKMKWNGFNILTSPFIPENIIYFANENNFRLKKPRKLPKYVFRLFGKLIKIYIEDLEKRWRTVSRVTRG